MKILFLGYSDYLPSLIYELRDSRFVRAHEIDVAVVQTGARRAEQGLRGLARFVLRRLKDLDWEGIVLRKDLRFHAAIYREVSESLFAPPSLEFTKHLANVRVLSCSGLDNLPTPSRYDLMIVASFGKKIPHSMFSAPKHGTLNIHPSFLPDLRGGFPIYVQAYDPEAVKGTTIHVLTGEWDAGPIVAQRRYADGQALTSHELALLSARHAASMLDEMTGNEGRAISHAPGQKHETASFCNTRVKPRQSVGRMSPQCNFIGYVRANSARHLSPFTYGVYRGSLISVLAAERIASHSSTPSLFCKIVKAGAHDFHVHCGVTRYRLTSYVYGGKWIHE